PASSSASTGSSSTPPPPSSRPAARSAAPARPPRRVDGDGPVEPGPDGSGPRAPEGRPVSGRSDRTLFSPVCPERDWRPPRPNGHGDGDAKETGRLPPAGRDRAGEHRGGAPGPGPPRPRGRGEGDRK